jgi:tRNA A-37 threonylcarbamoyl transferase component Bud32/DUF4097 and DUF4098 domain-containing protein YvlB
MSEEKRCAECGAVLTADAPHGLCPACLLKRGLAPSTGAGEPDNRGARSGFVPPPPAELAQHFPELEILELLGRGGMGVVYKARQKRLDRLVALKILPSSVGHSQAFAERFQREAQALARLTHPNIVAVHDFGQTDGLFYFVMEFVDGVNLRRLLDTGKISPKEALAIVPQICDALQFAHDKGVVHRDIKPENILLAKDGTVKIADFGLAKLVGVEAKDLTITSARDVIGTPHYMAPEQVEHPQEVDHRADIYSLGVVFYQMLTGELPIGRFAPPSRKVQIDVRLDEVVLRALEKEPEHRYQHASEVKTHVETIALTPSGGGGPAPTRSKSLISIVSQWVAAGVALLFACLVVLLAMSSEAIDSQTWSWFRLGLEIFAGIASVGFLLIVYRAITTRTTEARQLARVAVPWVAVMVLGILFGFWSPHLLRTKSDYIGQTWFPKGDSIEITSVFRSKDRMVVKGHYNLVGQDSAMLALYVTTTNREATATATDPRQELRISKGSGDFELLHPHLVPGLPHVSMYADGHPFASVYFGTKTEALEEGRANWITNVLPSSLSAREHVGQTLPAPTQPVVEQIQMAFTELRKLKGMAAGQQYELEVGGKKVLGSGDDFLRRRTGAEILDSGLSSGCGDYAIAFVYLMEKRGLQTLFVDSAEVSLSSLDSHFSGHTVVAVRDPIDDKWLLVDPTSKWIITSDWSTAARTFGADRYWIGYCGPLDRYPAHTPDELKEFYTKTLNSVPPDFWNKHIIGFVFKVDPSLIGSDGTYLNPNIPQLPQNEKEVLEKFHIRPEREVSILLVKGGDDAHSSLTHSDKAGWVCTLGLRSACSLGLITYLQNRVAGAETGGEPVSLQARPEPAANTAQALANGQASWITNAPHASAGASTTNKAPVQTAIPSPTNTSRADAATGSIQQVIEPGSEANFSRSLVVEPGGKLTMSVDRGDVHIVGSDQTTMDIQIEREVTRASDSDAATILKEEHLVLKQTGNQISITADNPPSLRRHSFWGWWAQPNLNVHYRIILPRKFNVQSETSGGSVNVASIQGGVHITTMGGHLDCEDIDGDVDGHTMGGNVRATACKGSLLVETMGGGIAIENFTGPSLQATTEGGSVSADFAAAPKSDSELHTSGGNVKVRISKTAAITLDAHTDGGSVRTDLPVQVEGRFREGTLRGTINGGGPLLKLETSGGNIDILKR